MRRPALAVLALLICLVGSVAGHAAKLAGKFRGDTYTAPGGLFTAEYRLHGTSAADPCCQRSITDDYDPSTGVGVVSFSNEYGAINGIVWGPAPSAGDATQDLQAWLEVVVLPRLAKAAPTARILRSEARQVGEISALLAIADLPGAAAIGEFDFATRTVKPGDSVRGLLIFRRGNYFYALMNEMNLKGFFGPDRHYDPAAWDACQPELEAFLSVIRFAR